jgi:hypothetical protein
MYREIIAIGSEIHIKHTNTPCGQNAEFHVRPHPYWPVNTLRLGYKNQSVKAA